MSRSLIRTLLIAVVLAALPAASAVAVPDAPARTAPDPTLPTWTSDYEWPDGHGYAGWGEGVTGAAERDAFGLTPGLGAFPGLWMWPIGDREYRPGGAHWSLRAPGTTRIARATFDLAYRTKVFAQHCLVTGLRTGEETRDGTTECKPPAPPAREDDHPVSLFDPAGAPTAKEAFVELDLPECRTGRPQPCSKHIPSLDPTTNGPMARVRRVRLVLVDDDLPVVTPSRAFFELDGRYIDGRQSYPLRVDVSDAGAGVRGIDISHRGWPAPGDQHPALAAYASACDPAHRTPELGARVCPEADAIDLVVDTRPMPEGTRRFRAFSSDPAGNTGERRWTVVIDRTPPSPPKDLSFTKPEEGSAQPAWAAAHDPVLPDETPGSGVAGYRFRHRVEDGAWSAWTAVEAGERLGEEVYDHPAGTRVAFEAVAVDAVGNVSDVARVDGEVDGQAPEVDAYDRLATAAGGYLGSGPVGLAIWAGDGPGAGIRRLSLERQGGGEVVGADAGCTPRQLPGGRPWKDLCPAEAGHAFTVHTDTLPEGRSTLTAQAVDRARNVGQRRWDVIVDRSAPPAPADLQLSYFDEATRDATIAWDDVDDPALPDGTAGSGVARLEARYGIGGAPLGPWTRAADGLDFVGGGRGDTVTAEVRAVDAVGNVSAVASGTFVLEPVEVPEGVAFGTELPEGQVAAAAAPTLARAGGEGLVSALAFRLPRAAGCGVDRTDKPERKDADGYENVKFQVRASLVCVKGKEIFKSVRFKVCMQVEVGGRWSDYDFRGDDECESTRTIRNPGTFTLPITIDKLCYPGVHNVRLFFREDATFLSGAKITARDPGLHEESLACNEDAAWRYVATRPSSPSSALGTNLRNDGQRPPGAASATGTKGFDAHHIVAATQTTNGSPRSQSLGYSCQLEPNGERNGVWLRGSELKKKGEGNPAVREDSAGYRRLPSEGRRRAYHRSVHTKEYFTRVANALDGAVGENYNCNEGIAFDRVHDIKEALKDNRFDFGGLPGEGPPPGQD